MLKQARQQRLHQVAVAVTREHARAAAHLLGSKAVGVVEHLSVVKQSFQPRRVAEPDAQNVVRSRVVRRPRIDAGRAQPRAEGTYCERSVRSSRKGALR